MEVRYKRLFRCFFLFIGLVSPLFFYGQDIEFQNFEMPDSVDYQASFEVEGDLFNNGPSDFGGIVTMLFYVDTVLMPPPLPPAIFTFSQNNSFTNDPIESGDSEEYEVDLEASESFFNFFAAKDHIVIIWPLIDGVPSTNPNAIYIDTIHVREAIVSDTELTLGESDLSNIHISIYPNPTYENVNVRFSSVIDKFDRILINDMLGRTILEERINSRNSIQIPLDHIRSGIYFINIVSENGQILFSRRIAKIE